LIILVQLVCACLRHLRRPQSRLAALLLLARFGHHCDDEARLQRLVPYVVSMLDDPVAAVRATATRCLRALLEAVTVFPPSDADVFPLYVFPALQRLPTDPEDVVRTAFAESLAALAEASRRFLDSMHAMRLQAAAAAAAALTAAALTAAAPRSGGAGGGGAGGGGSARGSVGAAAPAGALVPVQGDAARRARIASGGAVGTAARSSSGGAGSGGRSGGDGAATAATAAAATAAASGGPTMVMGNYDKELSQLRAQIGRWFVLLASTNSAGAGGSLGGGGSGGGMRSGSISSGMGGAAAGGSGGGGSTVKRALLRDVARLCVFFGHESTLNSILPQLITFLNDRDWEVRAAFCQRIPAVCTFVGKVATARFILPCVENALVDVEETIIAAALHCLAALVSLALIPSHRLLPYLRDASPLLCHPGLAVRSAAVALAAAAAAALPAVDTWVVLLPLLRPYLRYGLAATEVDWTTVTDALRPPVTRGAFREAVLELCERRLAARRGGGGGGGGDGGGGGG
ncbi:unnamed protein product, partial [Phaeothamnion confervicola]